MKREKINNINISTRILKIHSKQAKKCGRSLNDRNYKDVLKEDINIVSLL